MIYGNERFYKVAESSNNYMFDWLAQHSRDAIFLDFACGNGGNAICAAKAGASCGWNRSVASVDRERREARKRSWCR